MTDSHLSAADQTKIDIRVPIMQTDLCKMQQYLRRLYYWFRLGPLIALEWLRRITTWAVTTNFSKPIRSDWFASNMYLLILGVGGAILFLR